jgi:FlaA1/EpsC-like NDP-sugar epimerase
MWGGELFVPKIPSYRITDVAEAIAPGIELRNCGIRPGEKLHEEMITETDALSTVELDDKYILLPSVAKWEVADFLKAFKGKMCDPGFHYSSGENTEWLSVEQLRTLIRDHVDPSFQP